MLKLLTPAHVIFLGVIISAIGGVWASYQQKTSAEVNAALNREIKESITGGDSFCYLTVTQLKNPNDVGLLLVNNAGKYPLYDLSMRMANLDDVEQLASREHNSLDVLKLGTSFTLGNLSAGLATSLGTIPLPRQKQLRFNVFFYARNGSFTELLRLKNVDGIWRQAIRVTPEFKPEQVIFEKIDPEYGEPNW